MPNAKDKPAHEIRIGVIKAAIRKNDTATGVRYNTAFSRLCEDHPTPAWRRFGLKPLARVRVFASR